ncbi:MAG: hypothetical protein COT85_06905 [Chlamydiae bacterium CG10_big_fil_rev_8_21_14_0_10_42_34]|nr:MAG: hypothetical protein COT85_06905 [Chlamydiae bacterium CG10_big_fil_rev_8_21_14_0_10_42_34]
MTDRDLLALDKMGFIPGPGENEDTFLARVAKVKKTFEAGDWIPEAHWDWVRIYLDQLYDVKPLYICAFYSNQSLAPWQGAAAWIEGKALNSIQLRESLRKGSYLKVYSREEILAHEAVHAARSGFNEDRYEEFFAFMTSEKKWRKVLGPILQRPWEAWPFLIFIVGAIFWPSFYLGAALWVAMGFFRLILRHSQLKKAAKQISFFVPDLRKVRAILFRLTDREIQAFSKGLNLKEYAEKQSCLRWKVIKSYL